MDTYKGDEESLEHRSRVVAQGIKRDWREDLLVAAPPSDAKKYDSALQTHKALRMRETSKKKERN